MTVNVSASLPGSKSVAARALTANALSPVPARLVNLPDCEDTRRLAENVPLLRGALHPDEASPASGGRARAFLGSGGASFRFFLAAAASVPGLRVEADCSDQLRRRPVGPLTEALRGLGAHISSADGKAPFLISGSRLAGGRMRMNADVSSQFVSALMLAAPMWGQGMRLTLEQEPVSAPYIEMTARVMRRFGAEAEVGGREIHVAPVPYRAPQEFEVEADWSAASYLYEMAALSPGLRFSASGLLHPAVSLQGDSRCAELFGRLGVATSFLADGTAGIFRNPRVPLPERVEWDLGGQPDLVPALAATLCALGVRFRIGGIGHLRHKESDRLSALVSELGKCGHVLQADGGSLTYEGEMCAVRGKPVIDTRGDHRMAMSIAPLAGRLPCGLEIDDPRVVDKSFPGYWDLFAAAR